jgi:hypothetical protein
MREFNYLGTKVINQLFIHEGIKSSLMLATIQSRTFCLLVCGLTKVKLRKYKTIFVPAFLYGCET